MGGRLDQDLSRTTLRVFFKHDSDPDTEFMPAMGAGVVDPLAPVNYADTACVASQLGQ